jgi:hypothetical protein
VSEAVNGQSRRSMLKRAFVLAAGAVGVGATARTARAELPVTLDAEKEVRLLGRDWRLETPGRRPGEAIRAGDHGAVYGELVDRPKGKVLGQFFGSRLALQSAPGARADAGIEVHTFVFPGGTLVGMGTSVAGDAVFAVVGGTGVYAGARGSYVAKQRLREQGGNGTAEFTLTLRS